jgi:hypothetical protein
MDAYCEHEGYRRHYSENDFYIHDLLNFNCETFINLFQRSIFRFHFAFKSVQLTVRFQDVKLRGRLQRYISKFAHLF